ncbi:hypothetical protein LZK98_08320 [Sphingomonas cannabina]|uniref:hypothetical protein n=1 Tax=Sphingomonas cannabina TaxID=2899123 RepID=UPI001F283095|nr:hypothetical protein [Sphingomonas cannabina]UIJ46934.1 hypothetical protein LZK98_08320 [Sphingomonas cannabina]
MSPREAWSKLADEEAKALVAVLEGEGRKVHVLVTAIEGDEVTLIRAVSDRTTRSDARGILQALDHERDRIAAKIERNS